MKKVFILIITCYTHLFSNVDYNHPEFNWQTFETDHFKIHFHDETEYTANASVAEIIYDPITQFYDFFPKEKTHNAH